MTIVMTGLGNKQLYNVNKRARMLHTRASYVLADQQTMADGLCPCYMG